MLYGLDTIVEPRFEILPPDVDAFVCVVSWQWSFCVANDILLNQVGVYHERVYADNVVSKFWFVSSFSSQH